MPLLQGLTRANAPVRPLNHIRPLIGTQKVGALGGDVFDSFYAEVRR